jgi:hypothetical protein
MFNESFVIFWANGNGGYVPTPSSNAADFNSFVIK